MQADPPNPPPLPDADLLSEAELSPLSIIRTETILSRLPIHNLSKKGTVDIQIMKAGPKGDIELRWEVSYSDRYGQAGQLAYKLDTIVIDQRIDEAGRPLPERLCLGSLNQIAEELGLSVDQGPTHKNLKRALRQNALAGITAKFRYKGNDGTERTLESTFTRYSVVFTGERLSNGRKADAVYIELNTTYREVLNNAPVRPLNFEYKKQLPPAAQRFYEIVSYKIFAALKYNQATAQLSYSEYCTFAAQQRYFDYEHFKKQMYKIHRPHLLSGYLAKVSYVETMDEEGRPDWLMCYEAGPKARAEYATFTGKKLRTTDASARPPLPGGQSSKATRRPWQRRLTLFPASGPELKSSAIMDRSLTEELGKRGIGESDARDLLSCLPPGQPILDQLEYGDYQIARQHGRIDNPPGFYISLLQRNVPVPPSFLSSRKAKAIQETNDRKQQALQHQAEAARSAEDAEAARLAAQFDQLAEHDRLALLAQVKAEQLAKTPQMRYWLDTNPDGSSFLTAAARKKLKGGWKPPKPRTLG